MSLAIENSLINENNENTNQYNALDNIYKGPRMTKEFFKKHCREQKLYQTPHLNDVLYLHFKGFSYIENLEEYTGLKCLWLENNGIKKISGLDNQKGLRSLFLHYNLIKKIENLENCPILDTLNISHNQVKKIENLECIKPLHTLNMANNYVEVVEDFEHLEKLLELAVLDLSNNHIDDPLIVQTLSRMPGLRVLNLMGNPVIRKIPAYRKTIILACKDLQYLDDRPVFPRERACVEAWERGGIAEEQAERKRWIDRERQRIMDSVNALIEMRDRYRAERQRQEMAQHPDSGFENYNENGNVDFNSEPENNNESSGEEDEPIYNYGASSTDDERRNTDSSDDDSDTSSDDFMKDRQISDDYSQYRTRIFDYSRTRQTAPQKLLIEELEPSTSQQTGEQDISSNSTHNNKEENRKTFEMMLEDISKVGYVQLDAGTSQDVQGAINEMTNKKEQEKDQNVNDEPQESPCETDMEILKHPAGNRETLDQVEMELLNDKIKKENELSENMGDDVHEEVNNESLPEVETDNVSDIENPIENREVQSQAETKNLTNDKIKTENEIFDNTSDDVRDGLSNEPLCKIDAANICEYNENRINMEQLKILLENNEITRFSDSAKPVQLDIPSRTGIISEMSISNNTTTQDCPPDNTDIHFEQCYPHNMDNNDLQTKLKSIFTIYDSQQVYENQIDSDDSESDDPGSSGSNNNIREENDFIQEIDRSDLPAYDIPKEIGEGDFIVEAKTKEELLVDLASGKKRINDAEEDKSYMELLTWNIEVPKENKIILEPIQRKKASNENAFKDELCEMILQSKKIEQPEYEVTLPKDIVEENDKILIPKNITHSICYQSTYSQKGIDLKQIDIKPPLVHNMLRMSKNHPVYQQVDGEMLPSEEVAEDTDEISNALTVSNKISEVREEIKEFNRLFDEFNEKSRLAKEKIFKDYNDTLEKEIKIINKFMSLQQEATNKKIIWPKKRSTVAKVEITDEYLKKHFGDMGMYLPEDLEDNPHLIRKSSINQSVKAVVQDDVNAELQVNETEKRLKVQLETIKELVEKEELEEQQKAAKAEMDLAERNRLRRLQETLSADFTTNDTETITENMDITPNSTENKEGEIIRRHVTCSIEMQLARNKK
ncbi:hypothetical protein GWI33_022681 [Rhynchophorus ferrugineus]|uniref:Dynein axonemal assembly factor 1 homolog n=1 Tax=Rhynchophorus ferrugineus TaxID=354439 RepID=A0A834IUD2_RHYFE|nr:hypothetical protein GWI33_022681 [Rhynchophorus ferrugineus]